MIFSAPPIAGHRGWPTEHPDNTLAGIGMAFGVTDMVEIDIRQTLDGVLVLSHDNQIDGIEIGEATWADLSAVRIGGRHRIPLLTEVLEAFPDRRFDLELKNFPGFPGFSEELASVVAELSRLGDIITSFYWPDIDLIRTSHPNVATGLLFEDSMPGLQAIEYAGARGHRAVVPRFDTIEREEVTAAHEADLAVIAWTVNQTEDARRLFDWGVDVIVSDDPGSILIALEGFE